MLTFTARGGSPDPRGIKPPIGGSSYVFTCGETAVVIDFGIYPFAGAVRRDTTEPKEPEQADCITVGDEVWPMLRGVHDLDILLQNDSTYFGPGGLGVNYVPEWEHLRNAKRIIVIATHAHLDHIGALPLLKKLFPHAVVFMTEETLQIASWVWDDQIKLCAANNLHPTFDTPEIENLTSGVHILQPWEAVSLDDVDLHFFPAGHIIGALSVLVSFKAANRAVFVSGDISFEDQRTVRGAPLLTAKALGRVDYLIAEATYASGSSGQTRSATEARLLRDAEECLSRGAKFLCGALSIGRAQEIFRIFHDSGFTARWPGTVKIDGSAREIAKTYIRSGKLPTDVRSHFVSGPAERERLMNGFDPVVMITPAGMYNGGHAVGYVRAWGGNAQNAVALTSYQDPSSLGYQLGRMQRGDRVRFFQFDEKIELEWHATVSRYHLSAHLSGPEIAAMAERLAPERTFLVHGEESGMDAFINTNPFPTVKACLSETHEL